jgi:hypothetical protein
VTVSARVARLRESPVKGLAQTEVDELELTADGIRADRRFVCTDLDDRRLYSLDLRALARAAAAWDEAANRLTLSFPDGSTLSETVVLEEGEVPLRTVAGGSVHGRLVGGSFAAAMSSHAGRPLRLYHVRVGDGAPGPITLLGDGSLARLARELGVATLDPRRFKMSVEVDGLDDAEEDAWGGRLVRIGAALLRVGARVPRCALTTRDPLTGIRDHDTLRVLLRYRGPLPTGEPPFGVYATAVEPGRLRIGDAVSVVDPETAAAA